MIKEPDKNVKRSSNCLWQFPLTAEAVSRRTSKSAMQTLSRRKMPKTGIFYMDQRMPNIWAFFMLI